MVESSGLLNRRRGLNLYRGFESPPLRQNNPFRISRLPAIEGFPCTLVYMLSVAITAALVCGWTSIFLSWNRERLLNVLGGFSRKGHLNW